MNYQKIIGCLFLVGFSFFHTFAEKPASISSYPLDSADFAHLQSIDLPLIIVETVDREEPSYEIVYPPQGAGGIAIDANKVHGRLIMMLHEDTLYDSKDYVKGESGMDIKIRGNGSAAGTQKPGYKIKLQKKADLLRRGDDVYKDKEWLLLLDWNLKLLEMYWVNELLDLEWTPQCEFVNFVINGEYRGWFALSEGINWNTDCRLNVSKTGYIFESDHMWWNEDLHVESKDSPMVNWTFKYPDPEDITPDQLSYFTEEVHKMEDAIWTKDAVMNNVDIESFASWMIGQEILGQGDRYGANQYFVKYDNTLNTKIKAATLWDCEGVNLNKDAFASQHDWTPMWTMLFANHPEFVTAYVNKWKEVEPYIFDTLIQRVEAYEKSANAKAMDSSRLLRKWVYDWSDTCTVAVDAYNIKNWLTSRRIWLNNAIDPLYNKDLPYFNENRCDLNNSYIFTPLGVKATNQSSGIIIYVDPQGVPYKVLKQ